LIDLVNSAKENCILIGDFNMPDINWDTGEATAKYRDFVEAVENANMIQLVDFSTHIRGNCLYLLLTNMPERIAEVKDMGQLGGSDHVMVLVRTEKNWRERAHQEESKELEKSRLEQYETGDQVDRLAQGTKGQDNRGNVGMSERKNSCNN
jgi:hypothetical protein